MMSLWDALRMNMMISYQELVRTFPKYNKAVKNNDWNFSKYFEDNYPEARVNLANV